MYKVPKYIRKPGLIRTKRNFLRNLDTRTILVLTLITKKKDN